MDGEWIPVPPWAAGIGGVPAAGVVRVLGRLDGDVHVVATSGATRSVVAKRYANGAARQVARVMRAVHAALPADGPLAIPSVLACDAGGGVLVQRAAPGRPMLPLLADPSQRPAALRAAARALACLHGSRVTGGPTLSLADHLRDLVRPQPAEAGRALGDLGRRLAAVARAIVARDAQTEVVCAVPIHRDAHARQMLLDAGRVWLIDWDLSGCGDAALDVANFAVYLRTHLADGEAAAALFLDRYAAERADVAPRLAVHTAVTYVRLACKAFRLRRDGWRASVEALVSLAEAHM
jgi:aminoglycoside phosphotransferase (APT) family kinase protein